MFKKVIRAYYRFFSATTDRLFELGEEKSIKRYYGSIIGLIAFIVLLVIPFIVIGLIPVAAVCTVLCLLGMSIDVVFFSCLGAFILFCVPFMLWINKQKK